MALISQRKKTGSARRVLLVILLGGLTAGAFLLWRELRLPPPATVHVSSDRPGIGGKTVVTVTAREPRLGLDHVEVVASGAGFARALLAERRPEGTAPSARSGLKEVIIQVTLGKEATPDLRTGTLNLEVVARARGTKLRQPAPVKVTQSFEVRLEPPALSATSQFVHPTQSGAEAVVYEVGATSKRDGVQVKDWFFPGFPLPGGAPTQRFALFAAPYDLEVTEEQARDLIRLVAEDELGNRAEAQFIHKYFKRPLRKDVIELKDAFMQKVIGEVYARTPELRRKGTPLDDYLQLNRDLRQKNMVELRTVATRSQPKFLWSETFLPMQNAAVKGAFADRRAYLAAGKQVDTQDHLGFDLASLERAPVQAANDGVVVLARYFGIFGNCVVVDHGYGLQSLSAHLSTITVKDGQAVTRGQELGRTGATGLAGGDHLHFTMLLQGLPVTPVEWWDGHWIQDRLKLKLGAALPWPGSKATTK
jgi:murein DD-endopeptidase MepM/ murein hydrolase activator NlpD